MLEESFKKELLARGCALETNAKHLREAAYHLEEEARRKRIDADKMDTRAAECMRAAVAIPDPEDDEIPF